MSHEKIIRMANQIAVFFESSADEEDAARQTADHINQFWEPRMRAQLFAAMAETPDAFHQNVVAGIDHVKKVKASA